jgi:MFS family permease
MKDALTGVTLDPGSRDAGQTGNVATGDAGLFGWYRELDRKERRAFWACASGWSLDSMDANLYSFVIPTLMGLWGMTQADAGLLATCALLSSSVGGWFAGVLADRVGRVRIMQITVVWFAFFTGLSALTHSFNELLTVRILQGFGFGGEWAAGAVLMGEIIRDRHRGKGTGVVHSGWAVGWGAAALVYTLCFSLVPAAIAWRLLFAVGVLPAFAVLYIRRLVEEPAVFQQARREQAKAPRMAGLAIFGPQFLRTTVLASILAVGAQGGFYAISIWLPTYLKTVRHLSVLNTGGYLAVVIVSSFLGYVCGAYLADAIDRRKTFFLFSIGSVVTVAAYTALPLSDHWMLVLGIPLGFFPSGSYSGIGALLNEVYPTRIRGSGVGFCFNFGRAIGALFPTLVGMLAATIPLGEAIGCFAAGAYGLLVLAALCLPETHGRALAA